mgnify:CR=1 FL=1
MAVEGTVVARSGDGRVYGLDLPVITIRDMVRAQAKLLDRLGIDAGGLDAIDRRLLHTLVVTYKGRPVVLDTLARLILRRTEPHVKLH